MEVWELQLYFYPSAGGLKKKKNAVLLLVLPGSSVLFLSNELLVVYCCNCPDIYGRYYDDNFEMTKSMSFSAVAS